MLIKNMSDLEQALSLLTDQQPQQQNDSLGISKGREVQRTRWKDEI